MKFDGCRIQLHKHGRSAAAFTKNGHDHSYRVRWMTDALGLPGVRSCIIDGESQHATMRTSQTFTGCISQTRWWHPIRPLDLGIFETRIASLAGDYCV